jgi:hypothetical protein
MTARMGRAMMMPLVLDDRADRCGQATGERGAGSYEVTQVGWLGVGWFVLTDEADRSSGRHPGVQETYGSRHPDQHLRIITGNF